MSFRLEVDPDQVRDGGEPPPRRRFMVALVATLVLAVSVGGVWAAWRIMAHQGVGAAVPLIRADLRPVKVAPTNPGGMTVPDQDKYILNRGSLKEPRVEQLLPLPEAPLPRPVPAESAVTEAPPAAPPLPVAALPPVAVPPVSPPAAAPLITAPAPIAAPAVDPAPSVAAVTAPAAAPASTVSPPPPPAVAAQPASPVHPVAIGLGAAYRVQVGALRSPEDAEREWERLKRAQPDILGMLAERTVRIDRGAQGVFYRIEAGPMADADSGTRACDELKRRKVGCILVKP